MLADLLERHRALKKKIHATRVPLGPRGRAVMTCVYFFTPMLFGLVLFDWTNKSRNAKWGLEDDGSFKQETERRVMSQDESRLVEPKARLEQVFVQSNVDTSPHKKG